MYCFRALRAEAMLSAPETLWKEVLNVKQRGFYTVNEFLASET